ncbi:MAG: hypothetical protein MI923_24320 [Phycisphaerales bacterium]|nr:hypothetical protein [Phycisphaerales bacterium]
MANSTSSPTVAPITLGQGAARPMGITERNFLKAMLGTAVVVLVFWCAYKVERDVLHRSPGDIRYIREASEAAMRYITIPHIVIGFLFLVSSPKNRTTRKRLWTAGLLLTGVVLCTIYWKGGAKTNLLLYSSVYLYFLIHELRDEAMFYTVLGDAAPIPDKAVFNNMVRVLIGLTVFSIGAVAWAPAVFGAYHAKVVADGSALATSSLAGASLFDGSLPLGLKLLISTAPLLAAVIGFAVSLRYFAAKQGYPSAKVLVNTHAPLFRVMIGVTAVLGLAIFFTRRPYSLILFHVIAWYIFAGFQFKRFPPKTAPKGLWLWMRTTVKGFKTLHIGMAAVLMIIGLIWTLGLNQASYLEWLLAPESFLYWTIMHITVSFVPR